MVAAAYSPGVLGKFSFAVLTAPFGIDPKSKLHRGRVTHRNRAATVRERLGCHASPIQQQEVGVGPCFTIKAFGLDRESRGLQAKLRYPLLSMHIRFLVRVTFRHPAFPSSTAYTQLKIGRQPLMENSQGAHAVSH